MKLLLWAGLLVFSYLVGSIPFAYIAGRILKGIDIREFGDKNSGAANAYREISPNAGWAVLVADVLKGAVVTLLVQVAAPQPVVFLAGLAVVAGHNWPIYIGFRGGRGESTTVGVLLVLLPQAMLALLVICLVPFLLTRNTMLAGAILFAPLWFIAILMHMSGALVAYSAALPCLVGLTHLLIARHLPEEVKHEAIYMRRRNRLSTP